MSYSESPNMIPIELKMAFYDIRALRILAHSSPHEMHPAITLTEVKRLLTKKRFKGYIFITKKDRDTLLITGSCYLSFGDRTGRSKQTIAIAKEVIAELQKHGFITEWDGSRWKRIRISHPNATTRRVRDRSHIIMPKRKAIRKAFQALRKRNIAARMDYEGTSTKMSLHTLGRYPECRGFAFFDTKNAEALKTSGIFYIRFRSRGEYRSKIWTIRHLILLELRRVGLTATWSLEKRFYIKVDTNIDFYPIKKEIIG